MSDYIPCPSFIPCPPCIPCSTPCIGTYKVRARTYCVNDGNNNYTCTTTTEVLERLPAVCNCASCVTWYTGYHHMQTPFCSVGDILPPRFNVGTVALIPSGAHQHFSLGDGSSILDLSVQSVCGQTLDIGSWLPWPSIGTRQPNTAPLYYPPNFKGGMNYENAVAFIQSVFAPSIEGPDYVQFFGSPEHFNAEYYAVDIYPNNDYPPSNDGVMTGVPVYLAIADNEIATQVKSKVIFSGFINNTVANMVIVQHSTCSIPPTPPPAQFP